MEKLLRLNLIRVKLLRLNPSGKLLRLDPIPSVKLLRLNPIPGFL